MKHILTETGDDFKVLKEFEITVQNSTIFISITDNTNFQDVLVEDGGSATVDFALNIEDSYDVVSALEMALVRARTNEQKKNEKNN